MRDDEIKRKKEGEHHPLSTLNDAQQRAQHGSLFDFVTGLGWKGTGLILIIMLLGLAIYALFRG